MPLQQCQSDGKPGWRWGKSGKCYIGADANRRAMLQATAIRARGFAGNMVANALNPLRFDPSRLATLRRQFVTAARRRYQQLNARVQKLVLGEDVFGLKLTTWRPSLSGNTTLNTRWAFRTTAEQVDEFGKWLETQFTPIAGPGAPQDAWFAEYINDGYRRGAGRAFDQTRRPALSSPKGDVSDFYRGTREEFLRSSFAHPIAMDKLKLLTGRVLTDLKNVNSAAAADMKRVLADGLVRGAGPHEVAKALSKSIDGIGVRRAELIARTELMRAHNEGQLDALEKLGVTELGVMVEWSTAGDDRVCFPAWTTVETDRGSMPIQRIKVGMKVKTRNGLRPVLAVSVRPFAGEMKRIVAGKSRVTATGKHPCWTPRGWIPADELLPGDVLQTAENEFINIDSIHNLSFSESAHAPTMVAQIPIFAGIAGNVSVPVSPIYLEGCPAVGKHKINGISPNFGFLNVPDAKPVKRKANGFFDRGFSRRTPVTRDRAKPFRLLAGALAKFFAASIASLNNRWTATCFGAMDAGQSPLCIGELDPKACSTSKAKSPSARTVFGFARDRTVVVAGGDRDLDGKRFQAPNTGFCDQDASLGVITLPRTKPAPLMDFCLRSVNHFATFRARCVLTVLAGFRVALVRTIPTNTSRFSRLAALTERLLAVITNKIKRHGYHLLTDLSLSYHRMRGTLPLVYNIQVDEQPEFFVNGLLVHNCGLCADLEAVVLTIGEARGLIPRHTSCRCVYVPANVGEPTKGQVRSQGKIKDAITDSIKAEMPTTIPRTFAEQKALTRWGGADRKIAKVRPESILKTPPAPKLPEQFGTVKIAGVEKPLTLKFDKGTVLGPGRLFESKIQMSVKGFLQGEVFGEVVGAKSGRTARIISSSVGGLTKQGVGTRAYAKFALEMKRQGATEFVSDSRVSKEAVALWRSLERKLGVNLQVAPSLDDGAQLITKGAVPLFRLDLTKVKDADLARLMSGEL